MSQIECNTLYGEKKLVDISELKFRPSAYGVVKKDDAILLVRTSINNAYEFPGGGIELGETSRVAVERELIEETGVAVEVGELLLMLEDFFYHDGHQDATQCFLFVYACTALNDEVANKHLDVHGQATEEPVWVKIADLKESDFGASDILIFKKLKEKGLL